VQELGNKAVFKELLEGDKPTVETVPELNESSESDEAGSSEDSDEDGREKKGGGISLRGMTKEEKKAHKQRVKEEKREKRLHKVSKYEKKKYNQRMKK